MAAYLIGRAAMRFAAMEKCVALPLSSRRVATAPKTLDAAAKIGRARRPQIRFQLINFTLLNIA